MRYVEAKDGFSWEKRGKSFYAWCEHDPEKACKVIVRPRFSDLRKAVDAHMAFQHRNQMSLDFSEQQISDSPDVPPF